METVYIPSYFISFHQIMYHFLESYFLIREERKINRKTFLLRFFFIILLATACFYSYALNDYDWILWGAFIAFIFLLPQIIKRINDIGTRGWFITATYQSIVILIGILSFKGATNSNWSDLAFMMIVLPASEAIFLIILSLIPGNKWN